MTLMSDGKVHAALESRAAAVWGLPVAADPWDPPKVAISSRYPGFGTETVT